jgi:hypothetical protein
MVLELELDVGRSGLLACHHGIDELVERDVLFPLIITELSLLLFWSRFILRIGRNRNRSGKDQCAGGGKNATETHLENSS